MRRFCYHGFKGIVVNNHMLFNPLGFEGIKVIINSK